MERSGLSGRHRNHQAAAGALEQSGRARASVFLLPVGSHGNAYLARRSAGIGKSRHRHSIGRRRVYSALFQDGDWLRQNHRHGNADRLAGLEQGHVSAGRTVFETYLRRRTRTDREKPAASIRAGREKQLLRRIQHRPCCAARQAAPRQSTRAQLAHAQLGIGRTDRQEESPSTNAAPRATRLT